MNGFRTARALVIDDIPKQAMAIVQTLGALGIGSIYHDADFDRDYSSKHSGIHLLLLDMILENRGATEGDLPNIVSTLMGALDQILDQAPGFVVLVCWTRHDDVKALIGDAFARAFPNIHLAEVILVKKEDFIDLETGKLRDAAQFSALITKVRDIIERNEPAALLSGWEQLVHGAATKTTSAIYGAARTYSTSLGRSWDEGAYAVCSALAIAERGFRVVNEEPFFAIKGLTDALGPLLLDRIENFGEGEIDVSEAVAERLQETVRQEAELSKLSQSLLSPELRAKLNASLNLSLKVATGEVCPGNVYLMLRDTVNRTEPRQLLADGVWRELTDDTFVGLGGKAPANHYPIMVEVSPPCDFAQAKGKMPRFLIGFLIPIASNAPFRENAVYLKTVSFFQLAGLAGVTDGVYRLVLNAHYLVALPQSIAAKLNPCVRLRSAIMSDVVSWLAGHMSRPGFVQVTPVPAFPARETGGTFEAGCGI